MPRIFLYLKELKVFKNKKIKTNNTHGTGCGYQVLLQLIYRVETFKESCELELNMLTNQLNLI